MQRGRDSSGWDCVTGDGDSLTIDEMREEVEELRNLVKTLLTIIMEESDGVQTGAAPPIPNQPRRGYCM